MRKWMILLLTLVLLTSTAFALELPQTTAGQQALNDYVARLNDDLMSLNAAPVNSAFMCFPTLATLGITDEDNAEIPEAVEMTFQLYQTSLNTLQLRVSDPDRFALIAACCIHAAAPTQTSIEDALKITQPYAAKVKKNPLNSFEDDVIEQNGTTVRNYFAYYPNQYYNEINWLQMTLIFPLYGYDGAVMITPTPQIIVSDDEYEGITIHDNYTHFEVFVTATPEPNSPAGENGW